MTAQRIQRVEIPGILLSSVFCPFCGKEVVTTSPDGDDVAYQECPHTLFICTDEGFIFRSSKFDENLRCSGVKEEDLPLERYGYDGFTDECTILSSFKIATYDDAPSNFGFYIGFCVDD